MTQEFTAFTFLSLLKIALCSKLIGYIYEKNKHQDELNALILSKDQFLLYPIQNKYYDILENWNNMTQFQKLRVKLNTKRHF